MAGFFLSGQDSAIDMHATNATIVVVLCLVMTVLAFSAWRRKLLPRAAFTISLALLVVEIVQTGAGYGHVMWIHVPLGVLMMGGVAQLMPLVMRPYKPAAAE
jgi:heme A synthase